VITNDESKVRDEEAQRLIALVVRRISRRRLFHRAAGAAAGVFAGVVLGPLHGKLDVFAEDPCFPPCGVFCSGCSSFGDCPTGYQTCTLPDPFDPDGNCCIYSSGYWYTPDGHLCRDCRVTYCPCCCTAGCCYGFCGCRSA